MDFGLTLNKDNPKEKANFLSKLTYLWMARLFYKGSKKGLQVEDLYKNHNCDGSERVTDALERNWKTEVERAKSKSVVPSLLRAIVKTFFWSYMKFGIVMFVLFVGFRTFQPLVLAYIITQFSAVEDPRTVEKYASGSILIACLIIVAFMSHHSNYGVASEGMRVRVAVSSLIYRKLLILSQKSLGQTAAGQVINLLSNDVMRFDLVSLSLHYIWIAPFQVILVGYFIWDQVGVAAFAGIVSLILFTIPVQALMAKVASRLRLKIAQRTDYRVRLMNEIVSGIQVIKMYAWEKPFQRMVKTARDLEIKYLTSASYVRGFYLSSMVFVERTTLYLTIITYVLLGNDIRADQVFSMAQFFNLLQLAFAIFLPMAINVGAEMLISVQRLEEFLLLEEKQEAVIERTNDRAVALQTVSAEWVEQSPTLKDISVKIQPGSLCAIVGPVGAGKSSILHLLLGELPAKSGIVQVGGSISYSSQEPWLFASTVRNNILFGLDYDKSRYRKTVKYCALETDFEQLPQGDKTIVGERGVSLSGGQRARINLARAVYREADVYLMDDPLSAVDTHVGKQLFEGCIVGYLKGKTRILVTHQLQYLKQADHIVVLNGGTIEAQGRFEDLANSNLDFTKMLIAADETDDKEEKDERRMSVVSSGSFASVESEVVLKKNDEEYEEKGSNTFGVYMKAGGNWCVLLSLLVILLLGQAACTASDLWVTIWTEAEELRTQSKSTPERSLETYEVYTNDDTIPNPELYSYTIEKAAITVNGTEHNIYERDTYIYFYTAFIIAAIVVTTLRSFYYFKVAMIASKNIHARMFKALLKAPMRFFDTNPSGRILNRFSKDMGAIDEMLPRTLLEAIQIMLVMTGILISVTYSNYYMIIVIVILGVVFIKLRSIYLATARDIKHLEGIAKSPVFSHVNSSMNGITTIRAAHAEEILKKQFDCHQDVHTSAWALTLECMASFGLWLDLLAAVFIACIVYSFVLISPSGSLVGLALSQSMILSGMLQYGMRQSAEVVNQLTSVERVMQYTKLEKEGEFNTPKDKTPPKSWPSQGKIIFDHLYLYYTSFDPPVLKSLNFSVQPGEKIGIVGRTGAGKSSLISALFRLAPTQGKVIIDDIDTVSVGLTDLRKRISIIPQEPVLFSATLRYNLDPFNEFDDKKIWSALEEVELKDSIQTLDFMVTEGGSNFSVGQRQLICLARAIVRENKILIMDEATANVDPQTDSLIQKTIRRKFASSTVLTIAHRLNTIMDSDKVLVMEAGMMIQYDHPHLLLQNPKGHFYKMVEQTGATMASQLHEVAERAYKDKFIVTSL